eukprot:13435938-Alexandrium_andersonii.AAC.1
MSPPARGRGGTLGLGIARRPVGRATDRGGGASGRTLSAGHSYSDDCGPREVREHTKDQGWVPGR